jgi:Ni2+-binding GTPase involved in maturation of urease and hydrogenase
MEDQITMAFLSVMEQAMSILTVEEAGNLSTPHGRSIIDSMSTVIVKQLI